MDGVTESGFYLTEEEYFDLQMNGSDNETLDYSHDTHVYEELQYWLNGVLTNIVVILGLIGNILTIVILSQRAMRSSTNYYLTALAVWDSIVLICTFLLIGLIGMKFEAYQHHFHPYIVAYIYPLALIAQTATIWLTVSFTVERYIAVCHPLKAASMCTISRAKFVIIGVSVGSTLYNIPRWFDYKLERKFHPELNKTILTFDRTEFSQNPMYLTGYFSCLYVPFMFIIPFLVLFILNTFLILAVRQSQRNREIHMNVRQSRENNITIMLVTVVIVFMFCQLPALVYNLAFSIDIKMVNSSPGYHILSEIRNFMVNLNSAVNFLLYCALGQKFRRIFLHTFCRRCLQEHYIPMSGACHNTTIVSVPSHRPHRYNVHRQSFITDKDSKANNHNYVKTNKHTSQANVEKKTAKGCDYHAPNYKNTRTDARGYPATKNGSDPWTNRHQRAQEILNTDTERTCDTTSDKLLPEAKQGTYQLYKMHMNNGTRVAV